MATYITVDGGTTNTRIRLVRAHTVTDTVKLAIGAGGGIENREALRTAVRQGIEQLLARANVPSDSVEAILACGMLTSECGLCPLPHLTAPVGLRELHDGMYKTVLKDISDIPFVFFRGVKTVGRTAADADMMRGEETELMGLAQQGDSACVTVLPGSHSKLIRTDADGRITAFTTLLTGEMLSALSRHTILRDAVDMESAALCTDALSEGFALCRERGLNVALFKVRVRKTLLGDTADALYSFFLGAVLCAEIEELLRDCPPRILIGGKRQLREAEAFLLRKYTDSEVICISDSDAELATTAGMLKIYEYNGG